MAASLLPSLALDDDGCVVFDCEEPQEAMPCKEGMRHTFVTPSDILAHLEDAEDIEERAWRKADEEAGRVWNAWRVSRAKNKGAPPPPRVARLSAVDRTRRDVQGDLFRGVKPASWSHLCVHCGLSVTVKSRKGNRL